jgi:hypothetical protein
MVIFWCSLVARSALVICRSLARSSGLLSVNSYVLPLPHGKPCVPPRHHVHRTYEATIGTHISDELSGTIRQDSLATANCFDFPGNEDNCVRYLLTLFDNYLARREVDPAGKAGQF